MTAHVPSEAEFTTAEDRMRYVCGLLEQRDGVSVGELARLFGVSEVTVRSDLAVLAGRGLIARIRGGARALQRGQSEVAFNVRLRVQEQGKRDVAAAAAALIGDFASAVLRSTQIGKGFFGARGISIDRGLMDLNPDEVRFKRELAEACEQVVGVFDHTKWERSALLSFAPAERVDTLVTDERSPAELLEEWRERNVHVIAAPALRTKEVA